MTIKELIEQLQQVQNQNREIIIKGTGPDGWVYMNEIEKMYETTCNYIEYEGLIEIEPEDIEEYDQDELEEYFVIDGGTF